MKRIAVIVPAHNEAELLPRCLVAMSRAAARVAPVPVEVVVVADACTDGTAALAAAAGASVVVVHARNVGRARAAGAEHALRAGPDGLWLATTDADSRVGPDWLRRQVRHARAGAGLVVGTVAVDDWAVWPAGLPARYESLYRSAVSGTSHGHVHGANLGFSAEAYRAAGGFPAVTHDEDRELVRRAAEAGVTIVRDPRHPVRTSARQTGRAPLGFAAYLTALSTEKILADRVALDPAEC